MSAASKTVLALLCLVVLGMVVFSIVSEPYLARRMGPAARTRHAIEQAERIQKKVLTGSQNGMLSTNLPTAFGASLMRSKGVKEGFLRINEEGLLLDGWRQPLQIVLRSDLGLLPDVSPALLAKPNDVVIWSSGPNGVNEFGKGDDVFLRAK